MGLKKVLYIRTHFFNMFFLDFRPNFKSFLDNLWPKPRPQKLNLKGVSEYEKKVLISDPRLAL